MEYIGLLSGIIWILLLIPTFNLIRPKEAHKHWYGWSKDNTWWFIKTMTIITVCFVAFLFWLVVFLTP